MSDDLSIPQGMKRWNGGDCAPNHYSKATVEGNSSIRLAVTCLRRGRALERDSREG